MPARRAGRYGFFRVRQGGEDSARRASKKVTGAKQRETRQMRQRNGKTDCHGNGMAEVLFRRAGRMGALTAIGPWTSLDALPRSGREGWWSASQWPLHHRPAAAATIPDIASGQRQKSLLPGRRSRSNGGHGRRGRGRQQSPSLRPMRFDMCRSIQTVMTDLVESVGQDVLNEATQKLHGACLQLMRAFGGYATTVPAQLDSRPVYGPLRPEYDAYAPLCPNFG